MPVNFAIVPQESAGRYGNPSNGTASGAIWNGAPHGPGARRQRERSSLRRQSQPALHLTLQGPAPGLVHHSDRGVQYASAEYIGVLERNRIQGSMSRPGNPWDNARCESFMKTLKQEKSTAASTRDWRTWRRTSRVSSMTTTTWSGCTPAWATARPPRSSGSSCPQRHGELEA